MRKINISGELKVSAIALGAMNFGTSTSKDDAYRILDSYLDYGGNFIDTSNNYAHWQGTGDEIAGAVSHKGAHLFARTRF